MVLRDDEIKSFMSTLEESKLRPYTEEERIETEKKIASVIEERKRMKEYIEREALKRDLIDNKSFYPAIVKCSLESIPAADVKEVVHARWIWVEDTHPGFCTLRCSNCLNDEGARENAKFCPECGAQMDAEGE